MKILAVSSTGGHWIQLLRLKQLFDKHEMVYICTSNKADINGKFYRVIDASRWNKLTLLRQFIQVSKICIKEKPHVIISTGASVGIWAILLGRIQNKKTIWIDSIANYEKISLSGKLAMPFCSHFLTQWDHLSSDKVQYKGNLL